MSEEKESVEEQEKKKFFDGIDLTPHRKEGESQEEFKARRAINNKLMKAYKRGKRVYDPHHIVDVPDLKNGKVVVDEEGNPVYSGKKVILGPYRKNAYGELPD